MKNVNYKKTCPFNGMMSLRQFQRIFWTFNVKEKNSRNILVKELFNSVQYEAQYLVSKWKSCGAGQVSCVKSCCEDMKDCVSNMKSLLSAELAQLLSDFQGIHTFTWAYLSQSGHGCTIGISIWVSFWRDFEALCDGGTFENILSCF